MAQSRGRPIIPMPVHPERVISRAVKAGLSATIELQRNISNKTTMKHYMSSQDIWSIRQQVYQLTKTRGASDYSHILKAEPQIRDNMHKMFFENGAKFGFTEVSRQKKSDDTVGPINQRLNANGAALREFSQTMFPMPDPVDFGTRTKHDGTSSKKFRVAGYEGSSFGPRVTLAHPDLPSMDFGDAVRSHNEYLATFCAIHEVSVRETTRYSNLFLLLVCPYLEYIYSEYKVGKANFQKGVNWALRQVKQLILDSGYRPTMYTKRTVTGELENISTGNKEENMTFFERQEDEARSFYGDHPAVAELERLRGQDKVKVSETKRNEQTGESEDSFFTERDVEHIRRKAAKRSRIAGSILHRRIANLFPSPWHLNDVIYEGAKYENKSNYIIVSEVPLQTHYGSGKIDLILLERTITDDGKRIFGKPVFVLEIKTRKGHSWYIEPDCKISEVRRQPHLQRIVGKYPMNDYPLDEDMWDSVVKSTPTPIARKQLNIYSQGLISAYHKATRQELGGLLQGTIVIDSVAEIDTVRRLIERLVIHAYENVKHRTRKIRRTVFTPARNEQNRIALVVHEQMGPGRKEDEIPKIPWEPRYNPLKTNQKTKRQFILYLSGSTPTSSGPSASWNARNFHGLQMLHELKKARTNAEVAWIDLANQFNEVCLAETRLRLRPRGYSDEEIAKVHPDGIREFFENIKVRGHMDDIISFLYKDGELPSIELDIKADREKIVIVTGADTLWKATPESHREKLQILIDNLLSELPDDEKTIIVWFDSPSPSIEKATPYSSRALLPFHESSSLSDVVTDIVWNLPVAPKGAVQPDKWGLPIIGDSSIHDDIRVIIQHTPDMLLTELTHVPFLRGWSKRFRNKGSGLVIKEREFGDVVPEKSLRNRMKLLSLTLVPWLVRLWPQETIAEDSVETLELLFSKLDTEFRGVSDDITFTKATLDGTPIDPPSILDLLRFRLPDTMDALSFQAMTSGKINSHRLYRAPNKLMTQSLLEVPTPRIKIEVIKDEVDQERLFGIKFEDELDVTKPWWVVLQDPTNDARMLVGCFTHRPVAKDGFLWAETSQEVLTQHNLGDVLGLPQIIMTGSKTEEGIEVWSSSVGDDEAIESGCLEVISRGRSTVGQLRAIRQTFPKAHRTKPVSTGPPIESFYNRVVDSLRRYIGSVTRPTPVTVHLIMKDDKCKVTFTDEENGEQLQSAILEYTTDLISLLRWPMLKGRPMFTDSGVYVTWSVFDDVQFGELDFLRPYVSFKAARSTPERLPKRIAQFLDEVDTIQVGIAHDKTTCPISIGDAVDHGECWKITLSSDCSREVQRQLGKIMTGEDINGLLAPGRLYAGKLYKLKVSLPTVSEKDESIVFHEEKFIRIFLRNNGLVLKKLTPGTYLEVNKQQWIVSVSWEDETHLKWEAVSTVSGLFFKGNRHTIELTHGRGAEEERNRILELITSEVLQEQIANYSKLEDLLISDLRDLGYTKTSPQCELRVIKSTNSSFIFGIYPVERSSREPIHKITIKNTGEDSPDSLFQGFESSLSEGELSHFYIINNDPFLKKLESWVKRYIENNH